MLITELYACINISYCTLTTHIIITLLKNKDCYSYMHYLLFIKIFIPIDYRTTLKPCLRTTHMNWVHESSWVEFVVSLFFNLLRGWKDLHLSNEPIFTSIYGFDAWTNFILPNLKTLVNSLNSLSFNFLLTKTWVCLTFCCALFQI